MNLPGSHIGGQACRESREPVDLGGTKRKGLRFSSLDDKHVGEIGKAGSQKLKVQE